MATHEPDLQPLYAQHLHELKHRADACLARSERDHLVIAAGQPACRFLDDMDYPFFVNPHFKHWLPVTDAPGSWLVYTPGRRPKLVYLQPFDYWHVVPAEPAGYWVEHFDIVVIRSADEAAEHLPADPGHCIIIGEPSAAVGDFAPNNLDVALNYLHYHRAYKTEYELALMRVASLFGARAHLAAERAFRAGESEFGIQLAYLKAAAQGENELPYSNIVALNEHCAVLHYTGMDRVPPAQQHSFLIDAGASFHGYASDITRTWAASGGEFQEMIDAVDTVQLKLCDGVRSGKDYAQLHLQAHQLLAQVLVDHDFLHMSAEEAVRSGVSSVFFPHGLGHPIGLQVHDVAGFAADEHGGFIERPEGHPYLRMTRTLEPGMVVTIEPGLYFVDMLLGELRAKPEARQVNWEKIAQFRKFGGIRIEDDVVCTDGEPENLTRMAFASQA